MPDLVSKLREVSAHWKAESKRIKLLADKERSAHGREELMAQSVRYWMCADELESLLGREGQAAPATVPQRKVDFCGAVCMAWEDCGDKEYTHHCVLQADHQGKHKFSCSQVAQPAPSPSTPIAPGTAGSSSLSAPPVRPVTQVECSNCGTTCTVSCWKCGYSLVTEREVRIRKSVLEEAGKVARTHFLQYTGDNVATMELVDAIRALAERPAPAGEVKEKSDG